MSECIVECRNPEAQNCSVVGELELEVGTQSVS